MRSILLLIFAIAAVSGGFARSYRPSEVPNVQLADRTRFTSDPDGLLSPAAVAAIDSICYDLRHRGIAQVAVVALESIGGDDVFTYAVDLFGGWGVGRADRNNGLGILLVDDVHEIRFVTGGGLEGVLPDALCKRIQLKYMLPHFREGDYDTGMVEGLRAVQQLLTGSELDLGETDDFEEEFPVEVLLLLVFGFIVCPLALLFYVVRTKRRCPACHAWALQLDSQMRISRTQSYDLISYTYVCRKCGHKVVRKEKSYRNDGFGGTGGGTIVGGGFGRGMSGGSFGGGFGGGSFGGGGAGSRW